MNTVPKHRTRALRKGALVLCFCLGCKAGTRMGTSQLEVPPSQFFGFDRIDRSNVNQCHQYLSSSHAKTLNIFFTETKRKLPWRRSEKDHQKIFFYSTTKYTKNIARFIKRVKTFQALILGGFCSFL